MKRKYIVLLLLIVAGISIYIYKLNDYNSLVNYVLVTNKGEDSFNNKSKKWIEVKDQNQNMYKIFVPDVDIWNKIEIQKNYTLKSVKNDNYYELLNVYPDNYNGRIE